MCRETKLDCELSAYGKYIALHSDDVPRHHFLA